MEMSPALTNSPQGAQRASRREEGCSDWSLKARNLVHGGPRAFLLGQPRVDKAILTGNGEKGGETANCDSR